jgi:myo-inositol-1(or 4)-monophosphatase
MNSFGDEFSIAFGVVESCLIELRSYRDDDLEHRYSEFVPREVKAVADSLLEQKILNGLSTTKIPILSEEVGFVGVPRDDRLQWIVDPIDGTMNLVRGIYSCSVSIALCNGDSPIFGVVGELSSGKIYYGGKGWGAFVDDQQIRVSDIGDLSRAILCTGVPSRFIFSDNNVDKLIRNISLFGKIRMLGAASLSLLQVAKGSAEAYCEQEIMLWDVAAGVALVEGAGGVVDKTAGSEEYSLDIFASNGNFKWSTA